MVNQPFVKNEKANEGVMAFSFIKTVDEIKESQALDTDLKTWANAQGWKLSDEEQSVDDSASITILIRKTSKKAVYRITFSTDGTGVQDSHNRLYGGRSGGRPDILPGGYSCHGRG